MNFTDKQLQFIRTERAMSGFIAGVGSGKTTCGAARVMMRAGEYPLAPGLIGANTYLQLHKSTLPALFRILREHQRRFVFNKAPRGVKSMFVDHKNVLSIEIGNGVWHQIITYSLDNFDVIRGIQIGYAWIDETRDTDPEAFNVILERLRGFDHIYAGMPYQLWVTTTPNGFDWLWEKFVNPSTKLDNSDYVTSSSYENPFLSEAYAADLESRLGKTLARQQIYAEFLSLSTGRAFEFSRDRNLKPQVYDPSLPLLLTMDFNVAPLCALVMQIDKIKRTASVLEEIYIPDNGQTREACNVFVDRWYDKKPMVEFYGDTSGENRNTRGQTSDIAIMQETLGKNARNITEPKGRVKNGVNAVNAMLNPAKGLPRLMIDPKCPMLIRDLEQVSWKPGTTEIDKTNNLLTHFCFPAGTMISTPNGPKAIETIRPEQIVNSHLGQCAVQNQIETGERFLVKMGAGDGIIWGTAEHPFFDGAEYRPLSLLGGFTPWRMRSIIKAENSCEVGAGDITNLHGRMIVERCMSLFGKIILDPSQKITTFITKTEIGRTIQSIISSLSPRKSIERFMPMLLSELGRHQRSGMQVTKDALGTENMRLKHTLASAIQWNSPATIAERNLSLRKQVLDSVRITTRQHGVEDQELTPSPVLARFAEQNFRMTNINPRALAPVNAEPCSHTACVKRTQTKAAVYSLATAHGTYFAEGFLVSNCDSLRYPIQARFPVTAEQERNLERVARTSIYG